MKLLVFGAAGHVGSILRPALERHHDCSWFDLRPVAGAEARTTVGDVNDPRALEAALAGQEAVIYLSMGRHNQGIYDIAAAFDVNAQGVFRVVTAGLAAGARRFVYASTLSVVSPNLRNMRVTEETPVAPFDTYGLTKRMGEIVFQHAAAHHRGATLVILRLYGPLNEEGWRRNREQPTPDDFVLGPDDTREVFLAAVACPRPGAHLVQASGDMEGKMYPNTRAAEVLGWKPKGG